MSNTPAHSRPSRRRALLWGCALVLLGLLASATTLAWLVRGERWSAVASRTPMELVRYSERRLVGHPKLETVFGPLLQRIRQAYEKEPQAALPTLGKGQQDQALAAPGHDSRGRPRALISAAQATVLPTAAPTRSIGSVEELAAALAGAQPGQQIEVRPGRYAIANTLTTGHAGTPSRPIVVRAAKPGTVELAVSVEEGIRVSEPFWIFENLDWRGSCNSHDACEHAFHVVGGARGTVILNNSMRDFNAHVKINGEGGQWPDDGLLQYSTLSNAAPRRTGNPVSAIDLVGASGWQIVDNHVERIVKEGDNRISYGLCIKGGGQRMDIERNLVVCTPEQVSRPGLRVGISLGCGSTGQSFCRDGRCDPELHHSLVANNIVAHCNDFGIDLHRTSGATAAHNTVINTEGIDARQPSTRAKVVGNLVEGRIRARDGARVELLDNALARTLDSLLVDASALDLRWVEATDRSRATPEVERDFCGRQRPPMSPPGATLQPRCDLPK